MRSNPVLWPRVNGSFSRENSSLNGIVAGQRNLLLSRPEPFPTFFWKRLKYPIVLTEPGVTIVQFRKRIRSQMYYGAAILVVIVLVLSVMGMQGVSKFRKLTKDIRDRANELPKSARLSNEIANLRVTFSSLQTVPQAGDLTRRVLPNSNHIDFGDVNWLMALGNVKQALNDYERQLQLQSDHQSGLADNSLELASVEKIRKDLNWIFTNSRGVNFSDVIFHKSLDVKLEEVQGEASSLPAHMQQRMEAFAESARSDYHKWFTNGAIVTILGVIAVLWLMNRFRRRIFKPLDVLVCGSRRVASGDFEHRIEINTDDEVAELASAMNLMTSRFQEISADLNNQVKERTREVVRSEQMASVGFLAAGVAHEINNPLASIAWSAESLETRLYDILDPEMDQTEEQRSEEIADMKKYLKRIQDEAFRCKGITSSLLNFSRLGEAQKLQTQMTTLVEEVIDMLRPLSRYRGKEIELKCVRGVQAVVNSQELKQVVLNLVTNALDSIDQGGMVTVQLKQNSEEAQLIVTDNGCGMEPEVLNNIFQPFYTKRRDGQGTGLGLSISYRIIEEHGGSIRPESDGPGRGSKFTVSLPVVSHDQKNIKAA